MRSFRVTQAGHDDNSVVTAHPEVLDELGLFRGDIVLLKNFSKETVCIVLTDDTMPRDQVAINSVTRTNLHVGNGDYVLMGPQELPYGSKVHLLPFAEGLPKQVRFTLQAPKVPEVPLEFFRHTKRCFRGISLKCT
jgi:transitional endoplasmic reticulum ATPase